MKWDLSYAVLLLSVLVPASVNADTKAEIAPAPKVIKVTVHDAGIGQIDTTGFSSGDFCSDSQSVSKACADCRAAANAPCDKSCTQLSSGQFTVSSAGRPVDDVAPLGDKGSLFAPLLMAGGAWCTTSSGETPALTSVVVSADQQKQFPLSSATGAWRSFDNPNRFVWVGWDQPAFLPVLNDAMKSPWVCEFSPASTQPNGCRLTRERGTGKGVRLVFDADRAITNDTRITVKLAPKAAKPPAKSGANDGALIVLSLDTCSYSVKSGAPASGAQAFQGVQSPRGVAALYADADEERIEVSSSQGCLNQLVARPTLTLAVGNSHIQATPEVVGESADPRSAGKTYLLHVGAVPADVPLGMQEVKVRVGDSEIGSFHVEVRAPGLRVRETEDHDPALGVDYGSETLDASHSGKTVNGLAVVTPFSAEAATSIVNTAALDVDKGLLQLGASLSPQVADLAPCMAFKSSHRCGWTKPEGGAFLDETDAPTFCDAAKFVCGDQSDQSTYDRCQGVYLESRVDTCNELLKNRKTILDSTQDSQLETYRSKRPWFVTEASWGNNLWFNADWLYRGSAHLNDVSRLGFAVFTPQKDALTATADLRDAQGQTIFRATVVLAKGARAESLPLPLASALVVECGKAPPTTIKPAPRCRKLGPEPKEGNEAGDSSTAANKPADDRDCASNGTVKAVNDSDLDSGLCVLHYSTREMVDLLRRQRGAGDGATGTQEEAPSDEAHAEMARRKAAEADDQLGALLHLYGQQLVEVVVTRGTEPSVTMTWSIDPANDSVLPLPGVKARAGDYTVVAHLKGPQPLGVIYRPAPQSIQTTIGSASALPTDLEFHALLRPRGLGGWINDYVRTFITFPIRFSGLRFPAKSSELATSGDRTVVQLAGVRAGVLGVVEPWNYDTRQPRGVPVRFATGFDLYDLSSGKFAPSYLLGMSVTLPVLSVDGTPTARNLNSTIAVGAFWEVDLEEAKPLKTGNHLLLTFGLDFASLLSE